MITKLVEDIDNLISAEITHGDFYDPAVRLLNECSLILSNLLQGSPKWETAPEWARWLALDNDGELLWYWHENKPKINGRVWVSSGRPEFAGKLKDTNLWYFALEERPDEEEILLL